MEERERTPFGLRMLMARKNAKLKQEAVCAALEISQGTLSGLEWDAGGSSSTPRFAKLYKCNPHWLATGEGDPQFGTETVDVPTINAGGPEMFLAIAFAKLDEEFQDGGTKLEFYNELLGLIQERPRREAKHEERAQRQRTTAKPTATRQTRRGKAHAR